MEISVESKGPTRSRFLRARRIKRASLTELVLSYIAVVIAMFVAWQEIQHLADYQRLSALISNPLIQAAGIWLLMNIFSYILNQRTMFVSLLDRLGAKVLSEDDEEGFDDEGQARSDWKAIRKELETVNATLGKGTDTNIDFSGLLPRNEGAQLRSMFDRLSGLELDPVELEFGKYLERSRGAATTAQRRPNALLFIGTAIAVVGLAFFFITLPGFHFGAFSPSDLQAGQVSLQSLDVWTTGLQLLPRLLMLVFIQLLAGFFLKQYRASMEDFRYYESILRNREAQYLSYVLRKHSEDKKSLISFSKEIMEDRPLGILSKGQTTAILEAQRMERNEFASVLDVLAELVKSAKEKATGSQRRGRSKAPNHSKDGADE
jgi:hypothetical protein